MDKYLNTNIKDIINEFNSVQSELDKFEIGCAPCNLGTCKLKDVVEIHNLNAENEKKLITNIFNIIYPNETFEIPRIGKDQKASTSVSLSPPLKMLVEEHVLIKRVLALIPKITETLNLKLAEHKELVLNIADFIRNYADKYHHSKEEDILFKGFESTLEIINVMYCDHIQSRKYVVDMVKAVEKTNTELANKNLLNYFNLLSEHIQKEDNILYPWLNRNLETKQVGEIYSQFLKINNERPEIQPKYESLTNKLESLYLQK
ncbi:MAG: hypothetical protein A2046_11095 [Bacteroidetes bacterium GWA2_30_7]|nr:MAG: hypothetical protein A2046_11095 [Bacteroidetes bacterium GWA2_30_7]